MNVSSNLLEFLKNNDSAELFGIGTFKVQYSSASISPITNTLTPPCRSVSFNNDLSNDVAFAEDMAKNEFISIETAIKWITQYSDSIKDKIEIAGSCKIGDLGVLQKGQNDKYSFTPSQGLNLLDSAFAFSTIKNIKSFDQGDFIKPIVTKDPIKEEGIKEEIKHIEKEIVSVNVLTQKEVEPKIEEVNTVKIEEDITSKFEENTVDIKEDILSIENEQTKEIIFSENEEMRRVEQILEDECYDKSDCSELNYKNSKEFRKKESKRNKKEKSKRKERKRRNKLVWIILFSIILLGLLAFGALIFAHYNCWTKDIKSLEPITIKLSNYITSKCEKSDKTIEIAPAPAIIIPTETATETQTEVEIVEEAAPATQATSTKPITKKVTPKEEVLKPTGEKDNPPKPTAEIDYSTPILIQPVSRLGFDVIGGTYDNLSNAQQTARKARSLGYDSYIITKVADEKTKYYVSYGSRRTMREANVFLSNIAQKHGGAGFYIISR
ncbi:MAG: SPOR domain-containing protein [Bacteroidales bacterium]|jgi:cytoskeletal protein RodZ|nr:SPOR domain-containing protein [Bacteroidales bacterium]MDX9797512.1 SPOR domain-containing protein [Bacteroidales bacterium]